MKERAIIQKGKLILTLSLFVVIGFLTTSLVSFFISRSSLRHQIRTSSLPLTSDNIYSEIQRDLLRPIFISSLMANDTFLRDWILNGEKDTTEITDYLNTMMSKYDMFTSFFVSENTRIYYHASGILRKIKPDDKQDAWYFRAKKMKTDYEINVARDSVNKDTMTIFINHKVYDYAGNYIGVTGVGIPIKSVTSLIDKYDKKYNRNIYFTDKQGNIMLRGHRFPKRINNIHLMQGLSSLADSLLTSDKRIVTYSRQNHTIHLSTRFLPELNWYLFAEETEEHTIRHIYHALIINLTLCALITIVIISLTTLAINIYEKVNQKQKNEIIKQHEELIGKNKELEKALLEKSNALKINKLLMSEMNHRVKNNLAVIQSLLRLQSSKMHDNESKIILRESENRIRTISDIHRMLSNQMDLFKMDITQYIQKLVDKLAASTDLKTSDIQIKTQIQKIDMDMDLLIPFALILNELIINAFKYAFTNRKKGKIEILVQPVNNKIELTVKDDGVGLPKDFDIRKTDSLGMRIIQMLTEQIEGKLTITSKPRQGTTFQIVFKRK